MEQTKILLVDDEPFILAALERCLFDDDFEVHTASNGKLGLEKAAQVPFSVIMSDYRMPEMSGTEFLTRTREFCPNASRLLLTGYADMNAAVEAINLGGVHRFMTKPWNDQELRQAVQQGVERSRLLLENQRLLELTAEQNQQLLVWNDELEARIQQRTHEVENKNTELAQMIEQVKMGFLNSINIFSGMLEVYDQRLGGHSLRVADLASKLAVIAGLSPDYVEMVSIAAQLHDIGQIGIPKKILRAKEEDLTSQELALLRRHPVLGEEMVNFGERFEKVGRLIRGHHENFDGSGYPDGLRGSAIPIGARIIAIVNAYDHLITSANGVVVDQTEISSLFVLDNGQRFDPELVSPFLDLLNERNLTSSRELSCQITDLKPGMVIAREVRSLVGEVVLEQGRVLQAFDITRLKDFDREVGMASRIHVAG